MDKLLALQTFIEVAETGGFSRAGRKLGMATSSVMRLMDALEGSLGTALLSRTTRQINLTDAGHAYLAQVLPLLSDLRLADDSVAAAGTELRGSLRLAIPVTYGRLQLARHLNTFLDQHPRLSLDLVVSDAYVDLAAERIDLAIRIGVPAANPNLVVRVLADNERILVASTAYLQTHGTPTHPADLAQHQCLRFAYGAGPQRWRLSRAGEVEEVDIHGRLSANSLDLLFEAVLAGHGIALLPHWMLPAHSSKPRLQRLLPDWQVSPGMGEVQIHAAYLPNRRYSSKVRALIDHLSAQISS